MTKWQYFLSDLKSIGITQEQIQKETGISQPFLSQLKTGNRKNPSYEVGKKIEALHQKHCLKIKNP